MQRPLNFLHLTTFYPPYSFGGDAMYIYRLAHALGDEGHHVDVVHCVDSFRMLNGGDPVRQFPEHPRVKRHGVESGYGWISPFVTHQTGFPFFKIGLIRELIANRAYDVIHFHNISLLGPQVLQLSAGSAKSIKLYTTHEHWLICPMHVLWRYDQKACDKPTCTRCVLASKRPPQLWRYTGTLRRAARCVDLFVSPSRFTARMHQDRGFSRPVHHLPYFLDADAASTEAASQSPHPRPYFLFVGRLEFIKGLQTIIPLWERVKDHDLLVAGGETMAPRCAPWLRGIRASGSWETSQDELRPLYRQAVASLVPSITYETFGMSIIEGFTRKTPSIVRNLGALPEVVTEAEGGLIFNTDDEFLAAIERLAGSEALRHKLGEQGHRAFRRLWSREAHLALYFNYLSDTAVRKFGHIPWDPTVDANRLFRSTTAPS